MTVRRDPDGRWRYRVMVRKPDGLSVRLCGSAPKHDNSKEAVKQAEREHIARVLRPPAASVETPAAVPPKEVPTLREFSSSYLEASRLRNKPSSVGAKRILLDQHLIPRLGHLTLDAITYGVIEDFKIALAATPAYGDRQKVPPGGSPKMLSAKSINNCLTVLRRMLAVARKRGLIDVVPEVDWLRPPKPDFDFLTFDEAERLVAAAEGEIRTMILVGIRTGLRFGELIGLRWQDVDLVAGRIMVRQSIVLGQVGTPKSGHAREVPLGDDVRAALKAHRHLHGPLVFCDLGGEVYTVGEPRWFLERACKRAGLRLIGWHVLRHTFASHLAMRGAPLKAIQELLGHATIQMTMRYAHLAPEVARDAVRLLDRAANG